MQGRFPDDVSDERILTLGFMCLSKCAFFRDAMLSNIRKAGISASLTFLAHLLSFFEMIIEKYMLIAFHYQLYEKKTSSSNTALMNIVISDMIFEPESVNNQYPFDDS